MRVGSTTTILLLSVAFQPTGNARAQTEAPSAHVHLRVEPAGGCADEMALRTAVEQLLARSLFVEDAALANVHGAIVYAEAGAGWAATVTVSDAAGEVVGSRQVTVPSANCGALTNALALVLAIALDVPGQPTPLQLPDEGAEPTTTPSPAAWSGAPPPVPTAIPEAPPSTESPLALRLAVGARAALGRLPPLVASVVTSVSLVIDREWEIGVLGEFGPPVEFDTDFGTIDHWFAGGDLIGRWLPLVAPSPLRLGPRVAIGVAGIEARGNGIERPRSGSGVLVDLAAGAELRFVASNFDAALSLEVGVPLLRPEFEVEIGGDRQLAAAGEVVFGRLGVSIGLQ